MESHDCSHSEWTYTTWVNLTYQVILNLHIKSRGLFIHFFQRKYKSKVLSNIVNIYLCQHTRNV